MWILQRDPKRCFGCERSAEQGAAFSGRDPVPAPPGACPERPVCVAHSVPGRVREALQRERALQRGRQQAGGRVLPVPRRLPGGHVHRLRRWLLQLTEERDAQHLHRYLGPCPRPPVLGPCRRSPFLGALVNPAKGHGSASGPWTVLLPAPEQAQEGRVSPLSPRPLEKDRAGGRCVPSTLVLVLGDLGPAVSWQRSALALPLPGQDDPPAPCWAPAHVPAETAEPWHK